MNPLLPQLLSLIIALPLIAFWLWMFLEMRKNVSLPENSSAPLTWPPASKYTWTLAFIFLNVFAAAFYYAWEYKKQQ